MNIAVVGAGAIGGLLAAKFALAGENVTVVDVGAHLEAIKAKGLKLVHHDGSEETATGIRAVATCSEAGLQDLVFLSVKAYQIESLAPQLGALFGPETAIVTTQNGLPWWYFQNFTGPHAGYRLKTADPNGVIEQNVDANRIIGFVV